MSMGECNTFLSAYTMYKHLEEYCSHPIDIYSAKIKSTHFIIPNIFFIIVLAKTQVMYDVHNR